MNTFTGTTSSQGIHNCLKHFSWLFILSLFLIPLMNAQVVHPMHVETGWNLMSLPLNVFDGTKNYIFPTAVSDAFIYQGQYISKDTLKNGYGFWLKFDSAETLNIPGEAIYVDTITVQVGWNIIGSLTEQILVSNLNCEPGGIVISDYFYYRSDMGYQSSDTIKPGVGYWVKVNQDGKIILSSMGYPCPGTPTVEFEGKSYNTVQIGNQCWLKENLDIGTMIQSVDTAKDNDIVEKYCYNNDTSNCNTYGGLYQWNEAMQYTRTPGTRGICPAGWHIPTYREFQTLSTTVGGNSNALKAIGQGDSTEWWDGRGTNTSGFSALLSGGRSYNGAFYGLFYVAYFWSSTEGYSSYADYMDLNYYDSSIVLYSDCNKDYGFSVRCLKD